MCGITGFLHVDASRPAEQETLERMTRRLSHRGPDGEGFHVRGPVALGMRRLAIIDVEGGNQPLYDESGQVAVIQNGEIYNYKELRQELQLQGARFKTQSDTEVLVQAYKAWGDAFVERLNGMWAFALWDGGRNTLLLSRDRLGIKPLYYAFDGSSLVFGSEIKSILEWGWPQEPNREVLDAYVAFGFVPEPYSLYLGISRLPPGCNLTMSPGGRPAVCRYWQVPCVPEAEARRDEARVVEEFKELLGDAVRLQLRSDVPLGAFLSGGLDSSSIVALSAEQQEQPLKTFTIGFEPQDYDERPLARLVAERYATQHLERLVEPVDAAHSLDVLLQHFDEPFGDASALPTYVVSGIAADHVAVALSGDGGDEILAGYTRYLGEKFSVSFSRLPGFLRRRMLPNALEFGQRLAKGKLGDKIGRARRVVDAANVDFIERLTAKQSWSHPAWRRELLEEDKHIRPAGEFIEEALQDCPVRDNFHRLNWFDLKMMLPGQMLTKVDRMSMARSLEVRVPFLDHRLVELMMGVSMTIKLPGYRSKNVLRKAMHDRLPAALFEAPKKGFNVPVREWFRQPETTELLRQKMQHGQDLVRQAGVNRMLETHKQRSEDHGGSLWILLQLANWCGRLGAVKT